MTLARAFIFIHTLIPLLVLCVTRWTSAAETTGNILTTKLTRVIPDTLIYILTFEAGGVQKETLWTLTVEAASCILADAFWATYTGIRRTLIYISTGCVVLCKSWWTFTGKSTDGVDTCKLTAVWFVRTLIHISTRPAVVLKRITART